MPDRTNPFPSVEPGSGLADAPSLGKAFPVAFPLDEFYVRSGLPLPTVETLDPSELPEPQRSLLVHNNDMTPTLSAFHARIIHLRVLSRQQRDDFYFREVVLVTDGDDQPVEFGAIRINLALVSPALRRQIVHERAPLGHLLQLHEVPHSSRPKAYFRLEADSLISEALRLPRPEILYGRRNTLLNAAHRPLAEVVEILPPLPESPEGYIPVS